MPKENKDALSVMPETTTEKPSWLAMKPVELEKLILNLHEKGETPAKIGIILRDTHGVPKAKIVGKSISKIIKNAGKNLDTESSQVSIKIKKLETHLAKHKHDYTAKRSHMKKQWVINKLSKKTETQTAN